MGKLNRRAKQQVYEALDKSEFSYADFEVSYPEEDGLLAFVKFIPEPSYQLQFREPSTQTGNKFLLSYSPGSFMEVGEVRADNFIEAVRGLATWCSNIRADLRADSPWINELDDLRASFEEAIRKHVSDPEKHFTREEAAALQARLDDLISKFEQLHERNAITEDQLKLVKDELDQIKANTTSFKKATFFKTAGNKLFSLMMKVAGSKPAQEALVEATRHALGYGDNTHH